MFLMFQLGDDTKGVARPVSVAVQGVSALGGSYVQIIVTFSTSGWPGWPGRPLIVIARGVRLTVQAAGRRADVGWCLSVPGSAFIPPSHTGEGRLAFMLPLTPAMVESIEELRCGDDLTLDMEIVAEGHVASQVAQVGSVQARFDVSDKQWTTALGTAGFNDRVWIDVAISKDPGPGGANDAIRKALAARNRGVPPEAVANARIAVEAIEQAGFGGRAPSDVIAFIKQNARRLTNAERLAALRAAAELWFNPAHHPGQPEYDRTDASTAVAIAAALVALAERYPPPPPPKDPPPSGP